MFLPRARKRVIAAFAGIALLVCQTGAFAQACLAMTPAPEAMTTQAPCHGEGGQAGSSAPASSETGCHPASPAVPDAPVLAAMDDAPVLVVRVAEIAVPALAFESLLRVEPPPHSILHCCLRN
jgi:hypothetical protein